MSNIPQRNSNQSMHNHTVKNTWPFLVVESERRGGKYSRDDDDLYIIGAVCVSVSKSHYLCIQRIYFSWWEFCFSFLKYFFLIFFKFLF